MLFPNPVVIAIGCQHWNSIYLKKKETPVCDPQKYYIKISLLAFTVSVQL